MSIVTTNANNFVQLKGNLTKDAISGISEKGNPWTIFTIGSNKNNNSKAAFITIKCWNEVANPTKELKQGDYISLHGEIASGSYEKDGKTHYETYVNAETILNITPKSEQTGN